MAGRFIRKPLQGCWYHSTGGPLSFLRVPLESSCALHSLHRAGRMMNKALSRWSQHTRSCSIKWTENIASKSSANEWECNQTLFPLRFHSSGQRCITTGFSSYGHLHTPTNFLASRTFSQLSIPIFPTCCLGAHGLRCTPKQHFIVRPYSSQSGRNSHWRSANQSTVTYMVAIAVTVVGLSYAAVPLYRLFCQASGYGGTVIVAKASEKVEKMVPVRERQLTIRCVVRWKPILCSCLDVVSSYYCTHTHTHTHTHTSHCISQV